MSDLFLASGSNADPALQDPNLSLGNPVPPTIASLEDLVSPALRAEVQAFLQPFGLEDLTDWALGTLGDGSFSPAQISIELETQPAFIQRFPTIFERRENGDPPVSIAEVLQFERQVSELASFWGIPEGVIDAQTQMTNNRSFNELQAVVADVAQFANEDPETVAQLTALYGVGVTRGEMIAFALDQDATLPIVQTRLEAARIAGAADQQGFGQLTAQEAELLSRQGLDPDQALQSFALLANSTELFGTLPGQAGEGFTREDQLALAAGDATVAQRLDTERQRRLGVFDEGGGFAGGVAGIGTAQ